MREESDVVAGGKPKEGSDGIGSSNHCNGSFCIRLRDLLEAGERRWGVVVVLFFCAVLCSLDWGFFLVFWFMRGAVDMFVCLFFGWRAEGDLWVLMDSNEDRGGGMIGGRGRSRRG